MKKLILIFSILTANYSCKAQSDVIKYNNVTINSVNYLGKNVSLVTQNFGLPNSIEDYYFEMQDVMTKKYKYNGILFYIVNNNVDSFVNLK